jgi:hypothetical protein
MEGLLLESDIRVEESTEVDRMLALVTKAMEGDIRKFAESLVGKKAKDLLGPGEFALRDALLKAGARALEAVVNDQKKSCTKAVV